MACSLNLLALGPDVNGTLRQSLPGKCLGSGVVSKASPVHVLLSCGQKSCGNVIDSEWQLRNSASALNRVESPWALVVWFLVEDLGQDPDVP